MNAPIAHIYGMGIHFPVAHTSVTQKNCFRIICVIISALIVKRMAQQHSSHTIAAGIITNQIKTDRMCFKCVRPKSGG